MIGHILNWNEDFVVLWAKTIIHKTLQTKPPKNVITKIALSLIRNEPLTDLNLSIPKATKATMFIASK